TSFAAILAAAGFAVGMALQGTLSNFAAGVMLLVFRPFKVGDYISVAGSEGVVEEIDLFTTRMNSLDNRHLIVPNSSIFGETIENFTKNDLRRVDVNVGAEYKADLRHTRQVLSDAIAVIPGGVSDPAPEVYLVELADSSVNWQCRVWCRPENYWEVRQRVTTVAKDALDNAGIGIPFPQMDLHVITNLAAQTDTSIKAA
ncbi:MAG: mechanosensitive ion channel family protein, partial [Planctomycetota bacterium]